MWRWISALDANQLQFGVSSEDAAGEEEEEAAGAEEAYFALARSDHARLT